MFQSVQSVFGRSAMLVRGLKQGWMVVPRTNCFLKLASTPAKHMLSPMDWISFLLCHPSSQYGAAFKLVRHESFAPRRLITNSRNSALSRGFWNRFLKEASQVDGRTKDSIMKKLLQGLVRHTNSPTDEPIQDGRPIDPITPQSGPALFCLCYSLAEISENSVMFTVTVHKISSEKGNSLKVMQRGRVSCEQILHCMPHNGNREFSKHVFTTWRKVCLCAFIGYSYSSSQPT